MKSSPFFRVIAALLTGAVLTFIFFGQSILAGESLYFQMSEELFPLHANYPWDELIAKTFREGRFPLWNPYGGLGAPLLGNYLSGVFSPLKSIIYLYPSTLTREIYVFMRFALGAGCMILFCRRMGMKLPASLLAGIAFTFSGYFGAFHNETYLNAELLLPLWLLAGDYFVRTRSMRSASLLALSVAAILFNGHPEAAFHTLLFLALFIFFRLRLKSLGVLIGAMAVFIVGFFISAALLLPFVEAFSQSFNFHPAGVGRFHYDLKHLLSLALPWFWGDQAFYLSIKEMPGYERVSGMEGLSYMKTQLNWFPPYIGTISMALAGFAVLNIRRFGSKASFFALYAIVFTAATFGLPIFTKLFNLPFFSTGGNYKHCYPEITFCVAVLAGLVLNNVTIKAYHLKKLLFFIALIISVFLFIPYLLDHHEPAIAKEVAQRAVLFLGLSLIPLTLLRFRTKSWVIVPYILPVVLFIELFIGSQGIHRMLRKDPITLKENPTVKWLKENVRYSRVTSFSRELDPNFAAGLGIFDIRTHDALYPRRFVEAIYCLNGEDVVSGTNRYNSSGYISPIPKSVDSSFFNILNIKHFISVSDLSPLFFINDILSSSYIRSPKQNYLNFMLIRWGFYDLGISQPFSALYAHAPSHIRFSLNNQHQTQIKEKIEVSFSPIIKPTDSAIIENNSDGAFFDVYCAKDKLISTRLFSKHYRTTPHIMKNYNIDITKCNYIDLITHPLSNNINDRSAWAKLTNSVFNIYNRPYLGINLYNTKALKRVLFSKQLSSQEIDSNNYCGLIHSEHDFTESALIEKDGKLYSHELSDNIADQEIAGYMTDRVVIKVEAKDDGYLILSDMYYPGWRAFVGEEERKIIPANRVARAVEINKGDKNISFVYEPRAFKIGLFASIVSLLFSFGVIIINKNKTSQL